MNTTPTNQGMNRTSIFQKLSIFSILSAFALSSAVAQEVKEKNSEEVYNLEDFIVVADSLYMDQVNALKTPTPIIDV